MRGWEWGFSTAGCNLAQTFSFGSKSAFSPDNDREFIEFIVIMHVGHGHALP